jgi:protein tyrosine/serine phosphatase
MGLEMRRRRNLTVLAVLAVLLTSAILCYWMLQRKDIRFSRKFAVVKEGVLLRSEVPTTPRLQDMERRYRIKTIVALLNDDEVKDPVFGAEQDFAKQHGLDFVYLRMGVPTPEQVTKFLEVVNNPASQPVLVHCWHGTVRTSVLVAIYRIKEQGWPFQKALDEMVSYGFDPEAPLYKPMVDVVSAFAGTTESQGAPATNR